jgi:predicted acyltransferase
MSESAAQPGRKAVTIQGQLVSMGILGSAVTLCIFLENLRVAAWTPYILHILGAALLLAVAVPMLFFRRPVEPPRA